MMQATWTPKLSHLFKLAADELLPNKDTGRIDRSGALVSIAMQGAELGWSDLQIYSVVCDVADRWNLYKNRSDEELLLSNIVERARRKHPESIGGLFERSQGETEVNRQVVYTHGEFRRLKLVVNWVFEGLLALAGYGIFFGQPGVGKTQLMLQMVRAIATGKSFLDYRNISGGPKRVMFFSLEMSPEPLQYFTNKMDSTLSEDDLALVDENLLEVPLGEAMMLNKPEGQKFFKSLVDEFKPELVFIDSLGAMTEGTLNDDSSARELLNFIQQFKKATGCAVVVVHHANKQNTGRELSLSDFFGSQYLYSGTDFVLGLAFADKSDKSILQLTDCKNRLGPMRGPQLLVRSNNLTFDSFNGQINDDPDAGRSGLGPLFGEF